MQIVTSSFSTCEIISTQFYPIKFLHEQSISSILTKNDKEPNHGIYWYSQGRTHGVAWGREPPPRNFSEVLVEEKNQRKNRKIKRL